MRLERLGRDGVWSVGLEADGPTDLDAVTIFTEPVALVLGAEGEGLSALTRARCDVVARIDLVGPPRESLIVSAAGCSRLLRRQSLSAIALDGRSRSERDLAQQLSRRS